MKIFFLLLFLSSLAEAQEAAPAYLPVTRVLRARGHQIGLSGDTFATSKFVDKDGKKQTLEDGQSFRRSQSELSGYYGATNDLQFGLGVRFRQNRATFEQGTEELTATSSGLQSTFFSAMYAFDQVDQMQYTLEALFRYMPYSNQEFNGATDDPKVLILGDVGNEISAGLGATYSTKSQNFLTVKAGYRRPGTELSDEIYWQAEGALAWRRLALVAGVEGVSSLHNDPYEDDPAGRPIYNRRTELYGSSNREWIAPYGGINLSIGKSWRVELRGGQVVSGNSTDLGSTLSFNIVRRVEKSATKLLDSRFKTYDLEANVTKVSPKKEFVVLDKGIADDFVKGMKVDFFEFDYIGGNVLVATGVVIQTKSETCIVKITERYNMKKEIKPGLIGRASLK